MRSWISVPLEPQDPAGNGEVMEVSRFVCCALAGDKWHLLPCLLLWGATCVTRGLQSILSTFSYSYLISAGIAPMFLFVLLLLARFPPTIEHLCWRLFPPRQIRLHFLEFSVICHHAVTLLWWLWGHPLWLLEEQRQRGKVPWAHPAEPWGDLWAALWIWAPCLLHRQIRVSFMCRSHQERKIQRSGGMTPPLWPGDPAQHQLIVPVCASKSCDGDNRLVALSGALCPSWAPCGLKGFEIQEFLV